ncbi:RagB/SusD family nutrient uptake outer membrane protein [Winogradskyella forsetii]|uniref:RagB/SusD family nutrient uptake outer membrane protein n=1 Tax=Winogradskyella forsetii TaxID=2686077 RepID=UPI0021197C45|nr:RagB/SusD family nutrient uptake outer membrane protein [Winogradskyella forsetii]
MKTKARYMNRLTSIIQIIIMLIFLGCDDYLEVEFPDDKIDQSVVFLDEGYANAAIGSLYASLRDDVLLTGSINGTSVLNGLYSDELDYYSNTGSNLEAFYNHQIIADNSIVANIWSSSYNLIFNCNSAIEGLNASANLPQDLKDQLLGEALFIRALTHFYLVNLFGDVPYVKSTDYILNETVNRMNTGDVYNLITEDLLTAKSLLPTTYFTNDRIRANSYVVSALLSRVYLYTEQWDKARLESSLIIDASSLYVLENNLFNVFLNESMSTIFQLKPKNEGDNTIEASSFIFLTGPPSLIALSSELVGAFEPNDLRRTQWIDEVTDGTSVWYAPYKYKFQENTGVSMEYSIVFRLAEQYLIRAEARARLGQINASAADINVIRTRAGLSDTEASSAVELINAIIHERQVEFFTEHGHRWFDLKRLDRAEAILEPLKVNWQITDLLMPIPEGELLLNPNLAPQNDGY